jgi:hypothetical protein
MSENAGALERFLLRPLAREERHPASNAGTSSWVLVLKGARRSL